MISSLKQLKNRSFCCVGATGFEPTTPCSQSRCANRTALRPVCFKLLTTPYVEGMFALKAVQK